MKPFGENLKSLMSERNLTVSHIAAVIDEPVKTIQEWIGPRGRMPRTIRKIPQLAAYLKVSTHFLLFGEEEPKMEFDVRRLPESGIYEVTIRRLKADQ